MDTAQTGVRSGLSGKNRHKIFNLNVILVTSAQEVSVCVSVCALVYACVCVFLHIIQDVCLGLGSCLL